MISFKKYSAHNQFALFLLVALILSVLSCNDNSLDKIKLMPKLKSGLWGYTDASGKEFIRPKFILAYDFSQDGIALVSDKKGWLYIDKSGTEMFRPLTRFGQPDEFRNKRCRFISKGKIGFVNEKGRLAIPPIYDYVAEFSDGLAAYCNGCRQKFNGDTVEYYGGLWGYINTDGFESISPQFDSITPFRNGIAVVRIRDLWFKINKNGKAIE